MSELDQSGNPLSSEAAKRLEVINRFSKGEIHLGNDMVIRGEQEDRKIFITLSPDDPNYLKYLEGVKKDTELTNNLAKEFPDSQEFRNQMINSAFNLRRTQKDMLNVNAFSERINKLLEDASINLEKSIAQARSKEEIEKIIAESNQFSDLTTYATYLFGIRAVEAIPPEQQTK